MATLDTLPDSTALDQIAALLGSHVEWDSPADYLEEIADIVGRTCRPHPGDQSDEVLAHYRGLARRFGWEFDEDES